jgi:hypothetical protein
VSNNDKTSRLLELRRRAELRFLNAAEDALVERPLDPGKRENRIGQAAALAMVCGRIDTIFRREASNNRKDRR